MLPLDQLQKIRQQLDESGRIREILDDAGLIRPSANALGQVAREHAGETAAERYGVAQCLTLLELANKYREELHWPASAT
jgi:hypothetical protein